MGSRWYTPDLHRVIHDTLSIFPTMAPRLASQCRRHWCQVSAAKSWQLASCQSVIQITSHRYRSHWTWERNWRERSPQTPSCSLSLVTNLVNGYQWPLQKHMVSRWFAEDSEMGQAGTSWLQMLHIGFTYTEIQAFVPWWDKCLNVVVVTTWMSGVYHLLHTSHTHTHPHT
jgi:hypothetical protein